MPDPPSPPWHPPRPPVLPALITQRAQPPNPQTTSATKNLVTRDLDLVIHAFFPTPAASRQASSVVETVYYVDGTGGFDSPTERTNDTAVS